MRLQNDDAGPWMYVLRDAARSPTSGRGPALPTRPATGARFGGRRFNYELVCWAGRLQAGARRCRGTPPRFRREIGCADHVEDGAGAMRRMGPLSDMDASAAARPRTP